MLGRVDETDAMRRVAQVRLARGHRVQDPALLLDPKVLHVALVRRHQPDQGFRLVRVELVAHDDPLILRRRRHDPLDVRCEVRLRPRRTDARRQHLARRHIHAHDQRLRPVAHVLELGFVVPPAR